MSEFLVTLLGVLGAMGYVIVVIVLAVSALIRADDEEWIAAAVRMGAALLMLAVALAAFAVHEGHDPEPTSSCPRSEDVRRDTDAESTKEWTP